MTSEGRVVGLKVVGKGKRPFAGRLQDVILLEHPSASMELYAKAAMIRLDEAGPVEQRFASEGDEGAAAAAAEGGEEEDVSLAALSLFDEDDPSDVDSVIETPVSGGLTDVYSEWDKPEYSVDPVNVTRWPPRLPPHLATFDQASPSDFFRYFFPSAALARIVYATNTVLRSVGAEETCRE